MKLFADYQALMRIWTHPWVLRLAEIRQQNQVRTSHSDIRNRALPIGNWMSLSWAIGCRCHGPLDVAVMGHFVGGYHAMFNQTDVTSQ